MSKRFPILIGVLLLCSSALHAQGGMGGGMGGPPGGGPPGGGPSGGGRPGGGAPKPMKPVKRARMDKAVTAMFHDADTNRDGIVTVDEIRAIIETRRDEAIRARFAAVDTNHDGSIDNGEFIAWQKRMGSVASSESGALGDRSGPVAETIRPDLGDGPDDMLLARLIAPLSPTLVVEANSNYDAGMSLEELLAFEGKRFEAADRDGDGAVSMEEMRPAGRPGGGRPGGPPPPGEGGPPPCPPGESC